jgi:hypothetical protein
MRVMTVQAVVLRGFMGVLRFFDCFADLVVTVHAQGGRVLHGEFVLVILLLNVTIRAVFLRRLVDVPILSEFGVTLTRNAGGGGIELFRWLLRFARRGSPEAEQQGPSAHGGA